MRYPCPLDPRPVTPETCLARQECWDEGEHGRCSGNRCWRYVLDTYHNHRDRIHWLCQMETDRQDAERHPVPPAIGA